MIYIPIKENVSLHQLDLLQSPSGNFYQIRHFSDVDKVLTLDPVNFQDDAPLQMLFSIEKERLIGSGWKKRII